MARRNAKRAKSPPSTDGWWGDGPAPWLTWPGVSLVLDAEWNETLRRWESTCGRYYFDEAAASKPGLSASYFLPPRGELSGEPMRYLPWQDLLVIRPLFGWLRKADGRRRFRRVFVEVPKKNGKSIFCSALGAHLAFCDGEPGAQVYVAAGDEEQARIVWGDAAEMLRTSPDFLADAGVDVLANSLVQESTASSFRPLTAKAATKHGFDVHALIFDELHAQKSRDLYEVLKKGVSARKQPVILVITTAGDDRESICYEEHEYAVNVLEGQAVDEELLPVVFRMREGDDWTSPDVWHRLNPGLGTVKQLDYMESECRQAQNEPRKRNDFLRLDLNVWTESRTVWIAPESWAACARPGSTPHVRSEDPGDWRGLVCALGLDLSETTDLTALVAAFRRHDTRPADTVELEGEESEGGRRVVSVDFAVDLRAWFWLPEKTIRDRARAGHVPYDLWARQGWLTVCPGGMIDQEMIRRTIVRECMGAYQVKEVGFDPYGARQLAARMLSEDGVPMVEVRQGALSLSAPCKLLEGLVATGRIRHDGNPVLSWCFANAEVATDANGNIRPVKPGGDARGTRRIDGVVATVIALSRLMVLPMDRGPRKASDYLTSVTW